MGIDRDQINEAFVLGLATVGSAAPGEDTLYSPGPEFRTLHSTLLYQGDRRFLSVQPIVDGAPQISVRFSKQEMDEPQKVFVPLNFDVGDPVEVFSRLPSPAR